MKIDKVLWASSEEYSDFWNINSKIHNQYLDMDCVLLLYGKKENCNVSEEYGEVIEVDPIEDLPLILQIVLSKFYYPRNEPNTTWLLGDIDQLPLQRKHFVENLKDVPDDHYVHLAEDAITILKGLQTGCWKTHDECYLTAHYHVGKGSTFHQALNLDLPFSTHVKNLISYYYQKPFDKIDNINVNDLWAFEEQYTTSLIKKNYVDRFTGFERPHSRKICRSQNCRFDKNNKEYYVDIHCPRPYKQHEKQINDIINFFWE